MEIIENIGSAEKERNEKKSHTQHTKHHPENVETVQKALDIFLLLIQTFQTL